MEFTIEEDKGKTYAQLSSLSLWDKNPKFLLKEDRNRLINQVLDLGQYKPLLVLGEDVNIKGEVTSAGTVIGGNARYLVYTDQRGNGSSAYDRVWVSVLNFMFDSEKSAWYPVINGEKIDRRVFTDPMQIMIEYSQSDNDQAGKTDRQALAELVLPYKKVLPMENYKIQVFDQKPLKEIMDEFEAQDPEVPANDPSEAVEEEVVSLIIKFTPQQYSEIEPTIDRIKEHYGVTNNTDFFQQLLKDWNFKEEN